MIPIPVPDVDCPRCNAASTLAVFRADTKGSKWTECSCCSAIVLLNAQNQVSHVAQKN
jgi:hypothetical protein